MRAVIASFLHEANTFVAAPTELDRFTVAGTWCEDAASLSAWLAATPSEAAGACAAFTAAGWDAELVFAAESSAPGGRLSASCWAAVQTSLGARLGAALKTPTDAIVLHLHGACCAAGDAEHDAEDDCEGALVELMRERLGFTGRLVLSLDLHAHLTPRMLRHVKGQSVAKGQGIEGISAYRTMPHIDRAESGARAAKLCIDPRPRQVAMARLHALIDPLTTSHTGGPFAEMQAIARAAEQAAHADAEVDEVCLLPVQPWLDVAGLASAVCVTGRGPGLSRIAAQIAHAWWDQRSTWRSPLRTWPDIIARLHQPTCRPLVLADVGDAISGGSPGDSAEALARLLPYAATLPGQVLLHVVDADPALHTGPSGRRQVVLGQQRVACDADVTPLGSLSFTADGALTGGKRFAVGPSTRCDVGALSVLVTSVPTLGMCSAFYASAGLDASRALAVQSKSLMGWRAAFELGPEHGLWFPGPGATSPEYATLAFSPENRRLFPIQQPATPVTIPT